MSKLYFYYSAMNAGKTTTLLQSSYNYQERGMRTVLYTYISSDSNNNNNYFIQSRIGLTAFAKSFNNETNLFDQIVNMHQKKEIHCILVDECHFLNRIQVVDLTRIVDILNIPVLCYGLRTDFRSELFPGSLWLLAWADKLIELKTICYCGNQANRVLRVDNQGFVVKDGDQIMIGNNNHYVSVCRKHFTERSQSQFPVSKIHKY